MKQLSLIPSPNPYCGGSLNNTRQTKRVLSSKRPIHLVLKSRNPSHLFKNRLWLKSLAAKHAVKFGIQMYASSVQQDHIHFCIKIPNRMSYIGFIRTFTGLVARRLGKGVWKFRPFTRIATWGREFRGLMNYLFRNDMEVFGVWKYADRKRRINSG